jgi:hypothetical protein
VAVTGPLAMPMRTRTGPRAGSSSSTSTDLAACPQGPPTRVIQDPWMLS